MDSKKRSRRADGLKLKYMSLKILTGSDLSRRRLPVMIAESGKPGPVLWLTACGHGDEVGGIVTVQEVFKRLQRTGLLKGTLHAFPLMNPLGFETASRTISLSKEDLNRSFPGSKSGSVAERIAGRIFAAIEETNPALVLDLHNDWRQSIPYALVDAGKDIAQKESYKRAMRFAKETGFLVVVDSEEIRRTLSHTLIQHDIPALTLELGESHVVNEKNIEYGVKSIWNIMTHLGMTMAAAEKFSYDAPESFRGKTLKYADRPLSSTSGIIRFIARRGDTVRKGQPVAKIYNAFGKLQETITANSDAMVLGYSDSSVAFPGAPVMAFAVLEN